MPSVEQDPGGTEPKVPCDRQGKGLRAPPWAGPEQAGAGPQRGAGVEGDLGGVTQGAGAEGAPGQSTVPVPGPAVVIALCRFEEGAAASPHGAALQAGRLGGPGRDAM